MYQQVCTTAYISISIAIYPLRLLYNVCVPMCVCLSVHGIFLCYVALEVGIYTKHWAIMWKHTVSTARRSRWTVLPVLTALYNIIAI